MSESSSERSDCLGDPRSSDESSSDESSSDESSSDRSSSSYSSDDVAGGTRYRLEATLTGHDREVSSLVVLSHDRIVSSSMDCTIKIWDAKEGCVLTLVDDGGVQCVDVLPDGRRLVSGSNRGLKCWDLTNGSCLKTLTGGVVYVVAALPDDRGQILSGSRDSTVQLWDVNNGQCLLTLTGTEGSVTSLAIISPDRVVSGGDDDKLRCWDLINGRCLHVLSDNEDEQHSDMITGVAALPGGGVVSVSWDGTIKTWRDGRCDQTLKPESENPPQADDTSAEAMDREEAAYEEAQIQCVAVRRDGRIITGSNDGVVRVYDLAEERCLQRLRGRNAPVDNVELLPDGRLCSSSGDIIDIWVDTDLETEKRMAVEVGRQRACGDVVDLIKKFL